MAEADAHDGVTVKVTSLKVVDVFNSGTLTPNVEAVSSTWAQGTTTATYDLTLKDVTLTDEPQAITEANQTLLMLPQTLSEDAILEVTYTITTTNPARVITQSQTIALSSSEDVKAWGRNQQIVYTLNFGLHPIEFSAKVADWQDDEYIIPVE